MKRLLPACLACFMVAALAAKPAVWLTDLAQARKVAKKSQRPILLNFTGSDWCAGCIQMKRDVLGTEDFQKYAAKLLVLVEVDFPQEKPQSDALKQANAALKEKFFVGAYPTFVLLDAQGSELGRQVGGLRGGVAAFTNRIEQWKAAAAKPDAKVR